MKTLYSYIFLFLILQSNLFAGENILEFRLAFDKERPNTEVIFNKDVGRVFVEKLPFLTLIHILKVNLIIDNSEPPTWLEQAVKSSGGTVIKPQIELELILKESGKKIIKKVTSENIDKRIAVFVDGNCVMVPSILGKIDSDRFYIATSYNENEARELVDRLNESIRNREKNNIGLQRSAGTVRLLRPCIMCNS